MLEKDIEKYFRERVKASGGLAMKFVSPGIAGVPDRIVLYPGGEIYFVELKKPGKKMRPLQKKIANYIADFGFCVRVVDSKESADKFIMEVMSHE